MSKTYTFQDYEQAEAERVKAQAAYNAKVSKQATLRAKAEAVLARLDKSLEPITRASERADAQALNLKRRLLGPWDDVDSQAPAYGANRYLAGAKEGRDKHWSNRVWLRIVTRNERKPPLQWEVQLEAPGRVDANRDPVLGIDRGPGTRIEDLAKYKLVVDKILVELGWILVE